MRNLSILTTVLAIGLTPGWAQEATETDGATLFAENCAACHGETATGDGPTATTLATQPPDLTRIADRRDGVWPMFEVMAIIDGYTRATEPREDMPIIPALTGGPLIAFDTGNGIETQTPANLLAVVDFLESIQSPPPDRYVP